MDSKKLVLLYKPAGKTKKIVFSNCDKNKKDEAEEIQLGIFKDKTEETKPSSTQYQNFANPTYVDEIFKRELKRGNNSIGWEQFFPINKEAVLEDKEDKKNKKDKEEFEEVSNPINCKEEKVKCQSTFKYQLRSAETIFRFLGKLVKNTTTENSTPKSKYSYIFNLINGSPPQQAIFIKYQKETYYISPDDVNSLLVLSLLSQLISLNQSSEDLPATTSVIAVGQ